LAFTRFLNPPKTFPRIVPKSSNIFLAVLKRSASFPVASSALRVSFHVPVIFFKKLPKASIKGLAATRRIKNPS
jgi:hypothetical protein